MKLSKIEFKEVLEHENEYRFEAFWKFEDKGINWLSQIKLGRIPRSGNGPFNSDSVLFFFQNLLIFYSSIHLSFNFLFILVCNSSLLFE